jgi:N-acetylmuramoyl-L-alanine amidase
VSWFAQQRSQVSAHLVLSEDGSKCAQCVPYLKKAWHACNANDYSIGIELAGVQPNTLPQSQIDRLCRITAFLCHRFNVPVRWSGDSGHGWGGICTHKSLGAFGGNHGDPGGFDIERAIHQTQAELNRGGFRPSWGRD